ncbi:rve domain-containing protein/RVT_3 domain-containing protein, partial [Cephalotus follicularis]
RCRSYRYQRKTSPCLGRAIQDQKGPPPRNIQT